MNLFDIIGPVMVGPSSSHTAGAVKIGLAARMLLKEPVAEAEILLYGSFLATGKGHGTQKALVAGLMGMAPDDIRIPDSLLLVEDTGIAISFGVAELKDGHPNSVLLRLKGVSGQTLDLVGESLGGARINIASVNGLSANFSGEYPTLIAYYSDQPGRVADVASILAQLGINIAQMQSYRSSRGGDSVMIIECDQEIPSDALWQIQKCSGIHKLTYYSLEDMTL